MPYFLPTFNLAVNIWRTGLNPRTDPPSLTVMGNLQVGAKKQATDFWNATTVATSYGAFQLWAYLLLPAHTDVRPGWYALPTTQNQQDRVEVPAGSGRYYWVGPVEDVSKGFAAEYRVAGIIPDPPWPVPIP